MCRKLLDKFMSIILCAALLFTISVHTNAAVVETDVLDPLQSSSVITPFYVYINTTNTTLSISSGTATCKGTASESTTKYSSEKTY